MKHGHEPGRFSDTNRMPKQQNRLGALHPFLFALYPVLSLYATNLREIPFSDAWRSILFVLLLALSSYLKALKIGEMPIGRHRYLVPLMALFILGIFWWLRKQRVATQLSQFLLVGSIALSAFPVFQIGNYVLRTAFQTTPQELQHQSYLADVHAEVKPDIYYIVLDAYSREDVLAERFDFENAAFLDELRERGFYIAEQSSSNYLRTIFSITSTLNLNYLQNLDVEQLLAHDLFHHIHAESELSAESRRESHAVRLPGFARPASAK